jgi:amino acid transporter
LLIFFIDFSSFLQVLGGTAAPLVMSAFVSVSCVGTLHGQIFSGARMLFAGARYLQFSQL